MEKYLLGIGNLLLKQKIKFMEGIVNDLNKISYIRVHYFIIKHTQNVTRKKRFR